MLQGVKVGDLQATAQGFLSAYMFFVISNGKPLERLSEERPHPTIFCAYVFLSVTGQFVLHMAFLIYMYNRALRAMPEVHPPTLSLVMRSAMSSRCAPSEAPEQAAVSFRLRSCGRARTPALQASDLK